MKSTTIATRNAFVADARGVCWLVEMQFTTGTIYVTTWSTNLVIDGNTYIGLGKFAGIENMGESADITTEKLKLSLSVVDQAMLAATIGNVESYRNRPLLISLQMLGSSFQPTGASVLRWSGYMDRVNVERKKEENGESGRIVMQCSRAGLARSRNYEGLRLNDSQQQLRFPGDKGFEYIQSLIEEPALWLSRDFQFRT